MDASGAMPFVGRNGSQYFFIFFSEDKNNILVELMPSRTAASYAKAIQAATDFFRRQ